MRKNILLLLVTGLILAATGCKNDINVLAPYKSITVVYGLLDQGDTAHYIRVNKAYEGPGDAYQMAKQFDSIYYPANQVTVQLQDYNSNGTLVKTITLTADSSIPLPAGTFSSPKQILYKTKSALNANDLYNLVVTNEKTGQVLTGSTTLLPDITFTNGLSGTSLSMSFTGTSSIKWSSTTGGRIYQMYVRFFYYEKAPSDSGEKYVDWVFPPQTANTLAGGFNMEYDYTGQAFLQFVKASIPVAAATERRADSLKVVFTTGSDDFNTYIQLSQPSLGIDQDKPSYTDVKNGVGIFTARHTQSVTKGLTTITADSLISSPTTAALNFVQHL